VTRVNSPIERKGSVPHSPPAPAAGPLDPATAPLRSIHTETFPELLTSIGASVLVSTYQAGKLVVLRADEAGLNTHFRGFNVPMGIALDGDRLAIGTGLEIWEFHNVPAVAARLEPARKHDACFLPRGSHTTGNIQIHEMGWGTEGLWFVNTRFCCLCTRDLNHSFVPRWRPPFITALAPEDRCHLNGMAMVEGVPRFVTALGVSDEARGWRPHKRDGGVVLDVPSGEFVARGLSMPHSPRVHNGQLWVLNSGAGGLGIIDPQTGRYENVATLPGFTRGLDFFGRYAFVGLSQVRESAVFSGIAIADRPVAERACGVWVVDIVTGQTVAFVKFEDQLQEIFAVQVMAGRRYPDVINDAPDLISDSFVLPDAPLDSVPEAYVRRTVRE
jgi:uncharacterized protein (TIGR03032 family)